MVEKLRKLTLLGALFPTLVQLAVGQSVRGTSISEKRVAEAITSAGIDVQPSQVEFLSDLRATTPDAVLKLITAIPASGGAARVELRCEDHRQCLPFYVLVHGIKPNRSRALLNDQTQGLQFAPQLVRGGDHATLILETGDARISMPVICLQSGLRGQTIRVRSNDGKRLYRGEVVAASLLRASL